MDLTSGIIMSPARELIGRHISHAIRPFDPGLIEIWRVDDPINLSHIIRVTSSTFVDDVFVFDGKQLYLFNHENDAANFVGSIAALYFNSLREPVPDNVELGSN